MPTGREVLRRGLLALDDVIGELEQTTHGKVWYRPVSIDALVTAYNSPTTFNVSDLSQTLKAFAAIPQSP